MGQKVRGNLIIIGGAEDKVGKKTILKYVADIVREKKGSLVILTTATKSLRRSETITDRCLKRWD